MGKTLITSEQIKEKLNAAMAASQALDGDCQKCRVSGVRPVTDERYDSDLA